MKSRLCTSLEGMGSRQRQALAAWRTSEQTGDGIAAVGRGTVEDEPDAGLLDIFLEEARDLLPHVGESLYKLQRTPGDATLIHPLLRPLHTIKGSARMAGAMQLGQSIHNLESRISEATRDGAPSVARVEEWLALYDASLQLFETLQAGATTKAAMHLPVASASDDAFSQPEKEIVRSPDIAPRIRVRAEILDRLLNQAGEISVSRSDMETQMNELRDGLVALGDNVARLGTLLRETRGQAETPPQDWHVDSLNVERIEQLYELAHMLEEGVDDVASLQKSLLDTVGHTQNSLIQQARLSREMQRELMHVRMVKFKTVEERLHRLVRGLAKETGKELQLQIIGGAVELDRSILEKMAGPLEHLLRNAAAHGIEPEHQRRIAGKSVAGQLLIEITQEGNEAMIQLSDDGKGLDLVRIREKTIEHGLICADEEVSDIELMDAIFHPGFTTNNKVTEIAGRGIGMDVVHAEVSSLGGRISVKTVAGRGARFIIHLPLSLAVAQVVQFALAEQAYAIPSLLVAQVLQIKRTDQEQVFRSGVLNWHNRKLPAYHLSALLGDDRCIPLRETFPVLVVKNDHDFLAILVDHVVGNREVVTKGIGPQLAHMTGVVGATVLGSGSIVLILNPIQLVQRHGHQMRLRNAVPDVSGKSA